MRSIAKLMKDWQFTERCSHRRRAAPYMERQGRSGRRERLLAGLLHLLHPLCSTGVRPGTAAGMAAI